MTQNSFQLISSAVTDRGLSEKRPQNEDSYLEMPECGLFSVADGVGGAQAGDVASQMAMEILGEAFTNLRDGGDVEELMEIAISRANGAIFQMSTELPQLSTMATTIVSLHVTANIATIGHVGDSRLYRLDPRGNLYRETQDHSVVEEEVRAGRMTPEQAEHHPSKNVISRALGAEQTVEIDMKTIMFEPNTTFLLCSDGITRHIPDAEMRNLLAQTIQPVEICRQMKDLCYSRGAEDNLTAVIVRIPGNEIAQEMDVEENTVATPRAPLVNSAIFANNSQEEYEIPTQNLQLPTGYDQNQNFQANNQISIPASASRIPETANYTGGEVIEPPKTATNYQTETNYEPVETKGGSGFGKFLLALVSLIIGGILGAGGVYYWLTTQPLKEVPIVETPKSADVSKYDFGNLLKAVDDNAKGFTESEKTPKDAMDHYRLGRAYFLISNFPKAKEHFSTAKELVSKLSQTETPYKKALENEIAMGLSLVENESAQKVFLEQKKSMSGSTSTNTGNTNAVSNTSTGSNVNNSENTNKIIN